MESFKIQAHRVEEFKKAMGENCMDSYSFCCVEGTIRVLVALDRGDSAEKAIEAMVGMGLTGFMAGCVSEIVSRFHQRGEEYRIAWNKKYGVDDSQAKGGIVNPAIVTIGERDV